MKHPAFTPLLDEDARAGLGLPEPFRTALGVNWTIPETSTRPYVAVGFVASRDGRVSFATPGHLGGGDVSRHNDHDLWLLALSRARADVVLVGDGTLRAEPAHLWTPEYIWPHRLEEFDSLRRSERREPLPVTAFLSVNGDVPSTAAVFSRPGTRVVILTTARGAGLASERTSDATAEVDIRVHGEHSVTITDALEGLASDGHRTVMCEGGPRVYGSLLASGCVDDELLTMAPIVIGADGDHPRPSLVEGVAFGYQSPPVSRLLTVCRANDYLFVRSTYGDK